MIVRIPEKRLRMPFLGIIRHIEPYNPIAAAEQYLGQKLGQVGFPHAGGTHKEKCPKRPAHIGQS